MNFEEAKNSTKEVAKKANTVHVTSDGSVYVNGDIEAIESHAKANKLEVFYIKPEIKPTKKSK